MDVSEVVLTVVAVTVGIMLTCSVLIPIASEQMEILEEGGLGTWSALVGVVVVCVLISLVIVALHNYSKR